MGRGEGRDRRERGQLGQFRSSCQTQAHQTRQQYAPALDDSRTEIHSENEGSLIRCQTWTQDRKPSQIPGVRSDHVHELEDGPRTWARGAEMTADSVIWVEVGMDIVMGK